MMAYIGGVRVRLAFGGSFTQSAENGTNDRWFRDRNGEQPSANLYQMCAQSYPQLSGGTSLASASSNVLPSSQQKAVRSLANKFRSSLQS